MSEPEIVQKARHIIARDDHENATLKSRILRPGLTEEYQLAIGVVEFYEQATRMMDAEQERLLLASEDEIRKEILADGRDPDEYLKAMDTVMKVTGENAILKHDLAKALANHSADLSERRTTAAPIIHECAPEFGDPETLLNSRDWLEAAIIAKGAKIVDSGIGAGGADLGFVLDGCEFGISLRPRLRTTISVIAAPASVPDHLKCPENPQTCQRPTCDECVPAAIANISTDKQDLEGRIANVIERLNRKVTHPVIHPSDDWTRLGTEAAIVLAEAGAALSARGDSELIEVSRDVLKWIDSKEVTDTIRVQGSLSLSHPHLAVPITPEFSEWAARVLARFRDVISQYVGVCTHGKALNDYCEPCGRIHGA